MKLGLEQAVLGDAAGSLKPRDMEDLLKKGAYALTQMDEVDAMRCVRAYASVVYTCFHDRAVMGFLCARFLIFFSRC